MKLRITNVTPKDVPTVIRLMREFAAFENLIDHFEITEDRLNSVMFDDNAFVEGLIPLDDVDPIGYALFFPYFASFRGQRGMYLEDIYIRADHRGKGVGEAMLREIARIGTERGCERIDFMVLDRNTPAVKFYEKLGAIRDDDERHFKFVDSAFKALAS